jgi:hypothetical protein
MDEERTAPTEGRQSLTDQPAPAPRRIGGPRRIAAELGLSNPGQINTWASRRASNGFPTPVVEKAHTGRVGRPGNLYDIDEVIEWYGSYIPDKGGNPEFYKKERPVDEVPVEPTTNHNWPQDPTQHMWGPWYTDKGGKGVATQYRSCIDPTCKAVDRRPYPYG